MFWHHLIKSAILFSLCCFGTLLAQAERQVVMFDNFKLVYSHSLEGFAKRTTNLLKQQIPVLENEFRVELRGIYELDIVNSQEDFSEFTRKRVPAWGQALFLEDERRILIHTIYKNGLIGGFEQSLIHELVHLFISAKGLSSKIPVWMNEGLAQKYSGAKIGVEEGTRIANAIFAKKIISLAGIDSLNRFDHQRAALAYDQSFLATKFIENKIFSAQQNWPDFLDTIALEGFVAAFERKLGLQPVDFEFKYYRWMSNKYKWFFVFNLENLMWIVVLIVLAGAYYSIRYKNAKRLAEWELIEAQSAETIQDLEELSDREIDRTLE